VAALLHEHGASFFDEIVDGTGLMRTEVEAALGELVSRGLACSDSFAGLRALLTPSAKRKRFGHRRGGAIGIEDAGRWSLVRRAALPHGGPLESHATEDVEHVAFALLRRYGVVCARLLAREAAWLPPWRELLRVLRRLEARGDVRGGRFIADVSGEQFALPDAVALLREVRRAPTSGAITCVSAADPLNLLGTLLPGSRVPALATNRIALRDGEPVAALVAGTLSWLAPLEAGDARSVADALRRRHGGVPRLAYPR
jgi:ATP-dependent Lhr-like helicase